MKQKIVPLISHAVLFGVCFWGGRSFWNPQEAGAASLSQLSLKSSSTLPSGSNSTPEELLTAFLPKEAGYYRDLADTLPQPDDFPSALAALAGRMGEFSITDGTIGHFDQEQIEIAHQFHAHLRQWLLSDKEACLSYLKQMVLPDFEEPDIKRLALLSQPGALVDFLAEDGLLNHLDFFDLENYSELSNTFVYSFTKSIQNGESLNLLKDIEGRIGPLPDGVTFELLRYSSKLLPFEERDQFVAKVNSSERGRGYRAFFISSFLKNPNHPADKIRAWAEELQESDEFNLAEKLYFEKALSSAETSLLPRERVELASGLNPLRAEEVKQDTVASEVSGFLTNNRDYRYELRHGLVTPAEIITDFRAQEPDLFEDYADDTILQLYNELAKEAPETAVAVLDQLADTSQGVNARFEASKTTFDGVSPDIILAHARSLESLPQSSDFGSVWQYQARNLLERHGDDFVTWIKNLPAGQQRREAAKWTAQAAPSLFPHQAHLIINQLENLQ